jgi:POT family proton-dependent oligopeptide transporter
MKVIVQAINLLMAGMGSVVALALTAVAHDPNLLIFYASLTAGMAVTTMIFWVVFRMYDYQSSSSSDKESNKTSSPTVEQFDVGVHAPA